MTTLDLTVRYFQDSTPADVACREENFVRRQVEMQLPVEQTALVLVDLWNTHFIETWLERAVRVTKEAVVPAIEAARAAGLTIVQAPSPEVAAKFEQLQRHEPPAPVADASVRIFGKPSTRMRPRRLSSSSSFRQLCARLG